MLEHIIKNFSLFRSLKLIFKMILVRKKKHKSQNILVLKITKVIIKMILPPQSASYLSNQITKEYK